MASRSNIDPQRQREKRMCAHLEQPRGRGAQRIAFGVAERNRRASPPGSSAPGWRRGFPPRDVAFGIVAVALTRAGSRSIMNRNLLTRYLLMRESVGYQVKYASMVW